MQLTVQYPHSEFAEVVQANMNVTFAQCVRIEDLECFAVLFRDNTYLSGFDDFESAVNVAVQISYIRLLQDAGTLSPETADDLVRKFV